MQFLSFSSFNLRINHIHGQKYSILAVPDNSKETSVTLRQFEICWPMG